MSIQDLKKKLSHCMLSEKCLKLVRVKLNTDKTTKECPSHILLKAFSEVVEITLPVHFLIMLLRKSF